MATQLIADIKTSIKTNADTLLNANTPITKADHILVNTSMINDLVNNLWIPFGIALPFFGIESEIPANCRILKGASLSKTTYPKLFSVLGYTFGGSADNFNLPNILPGMSLIQTGTLTGYADGDSATLVVTLGGIGGKINHKLLSTESGVPAHIHQFGFGDPNNGGTVIGQGLTGGTGDTNSNTIQDASVTHPIMNPYIGTNWIMRIE